MSQTPDNPTKKYLPGMLGGIGGAMAYVLDNKPWFTYWDIPRLQREPYVNFLRSIWVSPLQQVSWSVKTNSPQVAETVQQAFHRFWTKSVPSLMRRYFFWGYAPGGAEFRVKDGRWKLDTVRPIEPRDAQVLVWSRGQRAGEFAGFSTGSTGKVSHPYAFWFRGRGEFGRFYDQPPAANLFDAWTEYATRGGAKHLRQLYMRKHSVSPAIAYFKPGETTWQDANGNTQTIDNKTLALTTLEAHEAGSNLAIASEFDDKGNRLWDVVPAEVKADAKTVSEYPNQLKREMAEAVGIPFEVIQAAESGSGFSGRSVPYMTWLGLMDEYAGLLVDQFEEAPLRQLVRVNHGPKADFEISLKSLLKDFQEKGKQEGQPGHEQGDLRQDPRSAQSLQQQRNDPYQMSSTVNQSVSRSIQVRLGTESFEMGAAKAPKGGVTVQGRDYAGGQFIPGDVMEQATKEERAAVEGKAKNSDGGRAVGNEKTPDHPVAKAIAEDTETMAVVAKARAVYESIQKPFTTEESMQMWAQRSKEFDELIKSGYTKEKVEEHQKKYDSILQQNIQAGEKVAEANNEMKQVVAEYLKPIRPVKINSKIDPKAAKNETRVKTIKEGISYIESVCEAVHEIDVKFVAERSRAFYIGGPYKEIGLTTKSDAATVVHELGHALEHQNPKIKAAVKEFIDYRIGDEQPVKLRDVFGGAEFDDDEIGRKDNFDRAFSETSAYYVGKVYKHGLSEILSMGIEALMSRPAEFLAKDPEYAAFVMRVLKGRV